VHQDTEIGRFVLTIRPGKAVQTDLLPPVPDHKFPWTAFQVDMVDAHTAVVWAQKPYVFDVAAE